MPSRPASEVAQRRFWNNLRDKPGLIHIGSYDSLENTQLWAGVPNPDYDPDDPASEPYLWYFVYSGEELTTGVLAPGHEDWYIPNLPPGCLPFPPEFKLARYWKLLYEKSIAGLTSVDYDGTNEWIFKPYSIEWGLVGSDRWMQGSDWNTANLFFDSSPHAVDEDGNISTSLWYHAAVTWLITGEREELAVEWVYGDFAIAVGWGQGGLLYGYLNDVYFGNNEMGGNKPNVGQGPVWAATGDLSKSYPGLWGSFGLSHGILVWKSASVKATWTFDLCDRAEQAAIASFNNEIAHLNEHGDDQTEGWGTDIVAVHDNVIEFDDGDTLTYRHFTIDVSPSRGTVNVYTVVGRRLDYGIDYITDECDKSGRSFRLLREFETNDPCSRIHRLVVTYLVTAETLRPTRHPGRVTDTNVDANRRDRNDIRGL